jgi:TRAP-type C4-dicarboxylate transport system permease small subunit
MQNRNTGIIATIAAVVLCGCPGLFMCIFGAVTATGNMPFNTEVNGISNAGTLPSTVGFVMLCLALIFILIPVGVGFFTLRKKPEVTTEEVPPAS